MAAMVASVEVRGYPATTVAHLVELSGVSRSAFYRHFPNKEACLLATAEEIVEAAAAAIRARYDEDRSWEERGREALATFLGLLVDQPAAARLILVEAYAAGPAATALIARATADFTTLARQALEQMPGREDMPEPMVEAIIGGLRDALQTRLRRREERELIPLAPDLLSAMLAYRTPPRDLNGGRRYLVVPPARASVPANELVDPAERIIAAATRIIAVRGYADTSLDAVVTEAGVSLSALYEHFDGKDAVMRAALDAGQAGMLAAAAPAYRRTREWPRAVREAISAILRFLAGDPDFARVGLVEVYSAGNWALDRQATTVAHLSRFLEPGFESYPETQPVAAELAVSSVLSLITEAVRNDRIAKLPTLTRLATYLALAPFLGSDEAAAVACGGQGGKEGPAMNARPS